MFKPTADHNVWREELEYERWIMETNLTDDLKVRLGGENSVTLTDGAGIQQVNIRIPKSDIEELLPGCYEKKNTENISTKFNLHRHYSLPFQDSFAENPEDNDIILPNIFEQNAAEDFSKRPVISLSRREIVIDSNSPTQIDITWSTENVTLGAKFLYDLEIMMDTEWEPLAEKRVTVMRLYKTDHSVSLGKVKWDLNKGDTVWHVRIRPRDSQTTYDWSDSLKIHICVSKSEGHFNPDDKAGSILY